MKNAQIKRLLTCLVKLRFWASILLILPLVASCGNLSNGRRWGRDATLFPGWERIKQSAVNVALKPETWAPAICAAVIQIDNADERISEWAVRHTPVFGSEERAGDASDLMVDATGIAYLATTLATPGGDNAKEWTKAKSKGFAVGLASLQVSKGATTFLKEATKREGPDKGGRLFPFDAYIEGFFPGGTRVAKSRIDSNVKHGKVCFQGWLYHAGRRSSLGACGRKKALSE